MQADWLAAARFVVAGFRADVARAGAGARDEAAARVAELGRRSPEFARIWRDNDVRSHGEGAKQLHPPLAGTLGFEYSAFNVDGRPDLGLIVFRPATDQDRARIARLLRDPAGSA